MSDQIGQGQFGKVFLATKVDNPSVHFGCKMVSTQNKTPKQVANMEKEALILSRFDHPNIIRLHQAVRTPNNIYLLTDYCDQGDLKNFMRKHAPHCGEQDGKGIFRFTEGEARYVVGQVIEAMKYLNARNIVHRDIKIDNILVKTKTQPMQF